MRELLVIYLKGFSMGAADVVPGVSGGTIALILGIYDRLIRALTAIDPRRLGAGLRLHEPAARDELATELRQMDVPFLLALGLGVASAVVVLASGMHVAVTAYPVPTYAFFFGLIGASAIVLYGQIDRWTGGRVLVSLVAILAAAGITGVTGDGFGHGPVIVFLTGAIAICAMVLPGVSGAFFLLMLGQYEYLTGVLSDFTAGIVRLLNGEAAAPVIEAGSVIAIFGAGAVVGLFSMAHIVRLALERYYAATLAGLVSLMVGALRLPFEEVVAGLGDTTAGGPIAAVLAGIAGVLLIVLLDRYTADLQYR